MNLMTFCNQQLGQTTSHNSAAAGIIPIANAGWHPPLPPPNREHYAADGEGLINHTNWFYYNSISSISNELAINLHVYF